MLLIADDVLARHEVSEDGLRYSRLTGHRGGPPSIRVEPIA